MTTMDTKVKQAVSWQRRHYTLREDYEQLTGQSIHEPGPVLIERYSHGGLSSGRVDPRFWAETGFPLLLAR